MQNIDPQEPLTIFYIDDDLDDLELFRLTIRKIDSNHQVFTFSTGRELLDALLSPPPHPYILFLDINMPYMNGIEILESIRKLDNNSNLPVVMYSTSMDRHFIRRSQELGANYYLTKPHTVQQMVEAIQYTLQKNWNDFDSQSNEFFHNYSTKIF